MDSKAMLRADVGFQIEPVFSAGFRALLQEPCLLAYQQCYCGSYGMSMTSSGSRDQNPERPITHGIIKEFVWKIIQGILKSVEAYSEKRVLRSLGRFGPSQDRSTICLGLADGESAPSPETEVREAAKLVWS